MASFVDKFLSVAGTKKARSSAQKRTGMNQRQAAASMAGTKSQRAKANTSATPTRKPAPTPTSPAKSVTRKVPPPAAPKARDNSTRELLSGKRPSSGSPPPVRPELRAAQKPKTSPVRSVTRRVPPPAAPAPVGAAKTAAGNYPVYKRDSKPASDFRSAFAAARKAGKSEFTWNGRRYNTKTK